MHRIATACRIQTLPWPTVIEATSARICKLADRPDRRKPEAPPNPEASEWATGRLRQVHASRIVALSVVFGRARRRGRIATMGIRVSEQPGAAAEVLRAAEAVACAEVAVACVAAVVADIDRSESCGKPI
jgi:hypothetical protein